MPDEPITTNCIRCGSAEVVEGEMFGHGIGSPRFFWGRRKTLQVFLNPRRLIVNYKSWGCRQCGLVWSNFSDLEKAKKLLPDNGRT